MPIAYAKSVARFEGECTVEEALDLAEWLRAGPRRKVDLAACTHLHAALLQTLLALRPKVAAPFAAGPLARWIQPLLPEAASSARRKQPAGDTAETSSNQGQ